MTGRRLSAGRMPQSHLQSTDQVSGWCSKQQTGSRWCWCPSSRSSCDAGSPPSVTKGYYCPRAPDTAMLLPELPSAPRDVEVPEPAFCRRRLRVVLVRKQPAPLHCRPADITEGYSPTAARRSHAAARAASAPRNIETGRSCICWAAVDDTAGAETTRSLFQYKHAGTLECVLILHPRALQPKQIWAEESR